VEAFPNGFLGVLMPEEELLSAPKLRRGQRFDWLYERMVTTGRLESVLSKSLQLDAKVWRRLDSERDHELRAALICLLTAALAAQGTAAVIGEPTGGWFWLPPLVAVAAMGETPPRSLPGGGSLSTDTNQVVEAVGTQRKMSSGRISNSPVAVKSY
jgi:hypothetical protein